MTGEPISPGVQHKRARSPDCVERSKKLHEEAIPMIAMHVYDQCRGWDGRGMGREAFSMRDDAIGSEGIDLLAGHYDIDSSAPEPGIAESQQVSYRKELLFASIEDLGASQQLVECGVRISTPVGDDGLTPLHVAVRNGSNEVASLLIYHGADMNAVTPDGETPLFVAAKLGASYGMRSLVSDKNINKPAKGGATPLFIAAAENRLQCVKVLAECGAKVDAANDLGETPLHAAAKNGHVAMVELLLKLGADSGACAADGGTPTSAACKNEEIVALLAKHTAVKA